MKEDPVLMTGSSSKLLVGGAGFEPATPRV